MSEAKEESLYEALNKGDLSAFLSMVEAGARITPREVLDINMGEYASGTR